MIEVILKLDKSSRARLSWIQSFAASFGLVPKPIYGHISLGMIPDDRLAACKEALKGQELLSVDFDRIGILPDAPVVAAMAVNHDRLEGIHNTVSPDTEWMPCVELLRDSVMNLSWVRTAMGGMFEPFTAGVERIEFMAGGTVVDTLELK